MKWLERFKCENHGQYHWEILVGVPLASALFSVYMVFLFSAPFVREWPYLGLLAIVGFLMSFGSLTILKFQAHSPAALIVSLIPFVNIAVAAWLLLSTNPPLATPTGVAENLKAVAKTQPATKLPVTLTPENDQTDRREFPPEDSEAEGAAKSWAFLAGAASVLEFFPPRGRIATESSDEDAIAQDWSAVASDLWATIGAFQTKQLPSTKSESAPSEGS
jgi:hypothetical protein